MQSPPIRRSERVLRQAVNPLLSLAALLLCFAVGEVAVRALGLNRQLDFVVDEDLYWRFRPNQTGFVWMGDGTFRSPEARVDNLGLRGADVEPGRSDRYRILMLGDSYTFGSGVEDDRTFSAVLQERLGREHVEVINAGVPGYGIFQEQRLLERLGPLLRPRMVIVTIPTGDVLRQPFPDAARKRSFLEHEKSMQRLRDVSQFATFLYRKYAYVKTRWTGAGGLPNQVTSGDAAGFAKLWQADETRLAALNKLCKQLGAQLLVMSWPQHRNPDWDRMIIDGVRELARREGFSGLLDLDQALGQTPNQELVIPGDGHPSAEAHRIAAAYLERAVGKLVPTAPDC